MSSTKRLKTKELQVFKIDGRIKKYIILKTTFFVQDKMAQYLFVYEDPQLSTRSFSHYLNERGVKLVHCSAARIDEETFIKVEFGHVFNFAEAHSLLADFKKSLTHVGEISVLYWNADDVLCQKFRTLSELGLTLPLTLSERETTLALDEAISSLDVLESSLNESGFWDPSRYHSSEPRLSKNPLIYSELNEINVNRFCIDAASTIAENLLCDLTSQKSAFSTRMLDDLIRNIRMVCRRGTMSSALGLARLVHVSKSSITRLLGLFSMILVEQDWTILHASPLSFEVASE